jgi:hypothetical protein
MMPRAAFDGAPDLLASGLQGVPGQGGQEEGLAAAFGGGAWSRAGA